MSNTTCTTGTCPCSSDCPCPPYDPDRHPITNCCQCNAVMPPSQGGTGPCDGGTPHDVNTRLSMLDDPYNRGCGCECDDGQTEKSQSGQYEFTLSTVPIFDADGNQVGTKTLRTGVTWVDGECPDARPDFVDCECVCSYDEDPTTCPGYPDTEPDPDPDVCDCICMLTDADCVSRDSTTPIADTESCSCVCDKPPCPANTPSFRASDCSCYCELLDEGGNHSCSGDTPDFDGSKCECYCAITSCPAGEKLAGCACVPCPNSCDGCQSYDADCNCTGCADCDETEFCFREDPSDTEDTCICCGPGLQECGGSCVDTSCPVGQSWDWTTCECGCPNDKVLCNGVCKNPCPEGQSFDANCVCVPDYTQAFLDIAFLP